MLKAILPFDRNDPVKRFPGLPPLARQTLPEATSPAVASPPGRGVNGKAAVAASAVVANPAPLTTVVLLAGAWPRR
jgi:hypothetical protein